MENLNQKLSQMDMKNMHKTNIKNIATSLN